MHEVIIGIERNFFGLFLSGRLRFYMNMNSPVLFYNLETGNLFAKRNGVSFRSRYIFSLQIQCSILCHFCLWLVDRLVFNGNEALKFNNLGNEC